MTQSELPVLTKKDFESDQDPRWCPGCGDYSILAQTQKTMPDFGVAKEKIVFISGIGCSGRLPYYMNTYGFHTIHGRAPVPPTGLRRTVCLRFVGPEVHYEFRAGRETTGNLSVEATEFIWEDMTDGRRCRDGKY